MRRLFLLVMLTVLVAPASSAWAQSFPSDDPIIKQIWAMGMDSSQVGALAQVLDDSIGPRLTGSPGMKAGNDWLVATYARWGISAENVQYGTWKGWKRGASHIDLIYHPASVRWGLLIGGLTLLLLGAALIWQRRRGRGGSPYPPARLVGLRFPTSPG